MPRTERQIAEYVEYFRTAPKEERQWALERIAEQEHKSPAEIREICEKYKLLNLRKGVPAPDDLKDKIGEKILSGMSTPEIREIYGVSENLIARVRQEIRDKGEKIPENRGGSPKMKIEPVIKSEGQKQLEAIIRPRHPEAYPGQIGDESKYDERELEFEKHIDELEARRETLRPETPRTNEDFETEAATGKSGVWYALLAQLEEFAVGTFGKGTVFDSGAASSEKKIARLGVLTPDRKKVQITIEELGE